MDPFKQVFRKTQACSRDHQYQSSRYLTTEANQDQSQMDPNGPIKDRSLMKLIERLQMDSIREAPQECSMQLDKKPRMMLQ